MTEVVANQIKLITAPELDPKGTTRGWGDSRPVFFVTFRSGERIVLKGELRAMTGKQADQSARWASKMMKQVSAEAKVKLLTDSELNALRGLTAFQFAGIGQAGRQTREYLLDLIQSRMFAFYKMGFVGDLGNVGSLIKAEDGKPIDKAKVKALLTEFKTNRVVLVNLGQVVAVDLFIGNTDRIGPDGRIVNAGNLFFRKQDQHRAIGIDFFEAQGEASNMFKPAPDDWHGAVLSDADALRRLATNVIDNLNGLFSNAVPEITKEELISPIGIGRFLNGLNGGIAALRTYLAGRITQGKSVPSGVQSRMQRLGWS